jgi:hypothetical protein
MPLHRFSQISRGDSLIYSPGRPICDQTTPTSPRIATPSTTVVFSRLNQYKGWGIKQDIT